MVLTALLTVGNEGEAEERSAPVVPERTQVIAHRAGAALAPENTLAAFEKTLTTGACAAEIDIRMTRDGVLVVAHDDSLERTTGVKRNIHEIRCEEIQGLDAGSWYAGDFAGERIPTLKEMMTAAQGKIGLMIELKCAGDGQELVEKTVNLIQSMDMEQECMIACTDLSLLQQSKSLNQKLITVYIGEELPQDLRKLDYVDEYSIQLTGLSEETVSRVRAAGKEVYSWTVNTTGEISRALELGVDGLVTDNPRLAMELIGGDHSGAGVEGTES